MEIGQAPSWSDLRDSSSESEAKQTSILLVDIVWTILIFAIFLGAAYLMKRTRDVCYHIANPDFIGNNKNKKPHDHLQINNLVDHDSSTSSGHSASLESSSWSSVGSNLSSFWGSRTHGVEIIRLSKSVKTATSTSIVGQSRLPATASLTLLELSPSRASGPPSITVTPSHDDGARARASNSHGAGFNFAEGESKRMHKISRLDNNVDELALSFPPGYGLYKHEGLAAAAAAAGGSRGGARKFRHVETFHANDQAQNVQTGERMHYEIHGSEENIQRELHASTKYDNVKRKRIRRGLVGGSRVGPGNENERSVEEDVEQQSQAASSSSSQGSRLVLGGSSPLLAAAESDVHVEVERCTCTMSCPSPTEIASCKSTGGSGPAHAHAADYNNIDFMSRIKQQPFSPDYDQFHFSDLEDDNDESNVNMIILEIGTGHGDKVDAIWG